MLLATMVANTAPVDLRALPMASSTWTAARLYEMGRISYAEMLQSQRDNRNIRMEAVDNWRDFCTASWTLSSILGKR